MRRRRVSDSGPYIGQSISDVSSALKSTKQSVSVEADKQTLCSVARALGARRLIRWIAAWGTLAFNRPYISSEIFIEDFLSII